MTQKLKFNHWLPKMFKLWGISLYPYILYADSPKDIPLRILRHETCHWTQQRKDGLRFYIKYLFFYFKNYLKYKNHNDAYLNIPYEIEARRAEWS